MDNLVEEDIEEDAPKACGKIGKRVSRFSVYGQNQPLLADKELTVEQGQSQILEVNESVTSESSHSYFGRETFKHGMFSGSQNEEENGTATPLNQTKTNLSEDENPTEDEVIWKSKYQEKLLNNALKSCSKFSLDGSGVLRQSNFKTNNHNSVVETGFGKKGNVISNPSLKASSIEKSQHLNRISIENQLSGFRPREEEGNSPGVLSHSPIPDAPPSLAKPPKVPELTASSLPFKNIQIPKNIFAKKQIQETSYRDSCDINLESQKSVIKFYEHWKINNLQQKKPPQSDKTLFIKQGNGDAPLEKDSPMDQSRGNLKKLISLVSEDSNYFDIFNGCPDSSSNHNNSSSEIAPSFLSKSRTKKSGTFEDQSEKKQDAPRDLVSQSSKKSNSNSLFKQYSITSKDSKIGVNLLSEFMSQTDKKSVNFAPSTINRDSIIVGPLSVLSGKPENPGWRNSANFHAKAKRESKFEIDSQVKKKYSVVNSKLMVSDFSGKEVNLKKTSTFSSDPWSQGPGDNQLIKMLSIHSQATDSLSVRDSFHSQSQLKSKKSSFMTSEKSQVLETKEIGDSEEKAAMDESGESLLVVKKGGGKLVKLKSNYSDEEDLPEKDGFLPKPVKEFRDNKKSLFEVSRDPTEMTNLLGKSRS